jgi:hypothetical protein
VARSMTALFFGVFFFAVLALAVFAVVLVGMVCPFPDVCALCARFKTSIRIGRAGLETGGTSPREFCIDLGCRGILN